MENQVVQIEWMDITHSDEPWLSVEEAKDLQPAKMTTVGVIIDDRVDSIVIVGSWGDEGEAGDVNCIPKSVIQSFTTLHPQI